MTWGFVTCGPNEALVVSGQPGSPAFGAFGVEHKSTQFLCWAPFSATLVCHYAKVSFLFCVCRKSSNKDSVTKTMEPILQMCDH
jgi:hypothetical protein